MKKSVIICAGVLAIAFAALATVSCSLLAHMNQSNFSMNFSLEKAAKQTGYSNMNCSSGGGGGGGGGGISAGTGGFGFGGGSSQYHSSVSLSCGVQDAPATASFDESQFLTLLKSELEKEIQTSGALIRESGKSSSNAFYFAYEAKSIRGRIDISGMRQGAYYTLSSAIDEKR